MPRPYSQLIPSIERRVSAWVSIAERRPAPAPPGKRPTITVSRQFGCEGFPLAERLKELMESRTGEHWAIYDKALLELVSEQDHLQPDLLEGLSDPVRKVETFGFLVPGYVAQSRVFDHLLTHITSLAQAGNAIIVGRGGAIITQKLPNCYHFRLVAPFEYRAASMARRMDLSDGEARRLVRENEVARERFIEKCLGVSTADPAHYDAVFNNARQGIPEIARAIVAYVAEAWKSGSGPSQKEGPRR